MEKIIITKEILGNASDAMPILEREELLEKIAQDCIVKVNMSYIPTGETEPRPMPDRYQEYRVRTSLYLMGVLAVKYLHMPFDGSDESLIMPAPLYDQWNASHVLSQIEALKADTEAREKAFNLLADYRDFRNALYREIETLLSHHNDVVWRFMDVFTSTINEAVSKAAEDAAQEATGADMSDEEREAKRQEAVNALTEAMDRLRAMKDGIEAAKQSMQEASGVNGGEQA